MIKRPAPFSLINLLSGFVALTQHTQDNYDGESLSEWQNKISTLINLVNPWSAAV